MLERQLQMPKTLQKKMEQGMGYDFSKVEMGESQKVTKMGFDAYAKGNTILFAPGRFNPFTLSGQRLIGHELGHIVQNTRGRVNAEQEIEGEQVNVDTSYEKEADDLSAKAMSLSDSIEGNDLVTADASASSIVQGGRNKGSKGSKGSKARKTTGTTTTAASSVVQGEGSGVGMTTGTAASASSEIQGERPEVRVTSGADRKGRRLGDGYDEALDKLRTWAVGGEVEGGHIHRLTGARNNQWAIDVKGTGRGRGGGRLIFTRDKAGNIDVIDAVGNHDY